MKITHGATFETPGLFRKEFLDAGPEDFPEAEGLPRRWWKLYAACRLEADLLELRQLFGNMAPEQAAASIRALDCMADQYLELGRADAEGRRPADFHHCAECGGGRMADALGMCVKCERPLLTPDAPAPVG